ncbi:hypothetical protein GCM10010441_03710 [Kitasatospora paracochleata]|uniref:Uncharacterized protein n=1 Tax=Kitasatospora paracochleata TaxID=58354 RepID=A0ABT1ISF3_9ACTN|nr:hypothetical protein [Kitasatospora paracochleata]MCP2308065.1 hypothetical protein [Kitasatospora paracochleata]
MALREHSRAVHDTVRHGRHGRPKPFGGRLRLPTLRFSGAAMAMSTVVGISLATTWLLNEQQQVGRRPGTSVGASPPVPSADQAADAAESPSPAPTGPDRPALADTAASATALPGARPSATAGKVAARPAGATSAAPSTSAPDPAQETAAASPSPSATPAPTGGPAGATPVAPTPTTAKPTATTPTTPKPTAPDTAFAGTAAVEALGRSGNRHTVELTVGTRLTALQVEFRLRRPDALPGTTPWTDLPGTVVTVALDRDTLVYRFTVLPGPDLGPGTYTFSVTGAVPAAGPTTPAETWTASAFALTDDPHAVAARGGFPAW